MALEPMENERVAPFGKEQQKINELIERWRSGETQAFNELVTTLHDELQRLAHLQFRRERASHTMHTNDLVSQLYLKMLGAKSVPWQDYTHFLNAAARTMRQILVDHARGWMRRADGKARASMEGMEERPEGRAKVPDDSEMARLLSVQETMVKMENLDPDMARIADLRITLGLTLEETAQALSLPINKVKREWLVIRKLMGSSVWSQEDK